MHIYVCKTAGDFVKIGIARDIKARLKGLQTGNAFRLHMIHSVVVADADAHRIEKHIHKTLRRQQAHMNGEWFRCTPERAIELVDRIAAMYSEYRAYNEEEAPPGTVLRNLYCPQCFRRGAMRVPVGTYPRCRCSQCGHTNPLIGGRDDIRPWWDAHWKAKEQAKSR